MQSNITPYKIALISVLAALCLAIQLTPRPPNVEFTSFLTFAVGFVFGSFLGVFFGGFVMFVNGFFSPWGFAGLNMPFQMVGMSLVGLAGGVYRMRTQTYSITGFCIESSILGAFFTMIYDLITNFGVALSAMVSGVQPTLAVITVLASGAPFSFVHVVSNIFVFGIVFFPLVKALNYIPMVRNHG